MKLNPGARITLIRYSEIALKGGNRKWFEDVLTSNIERLLRKSGRETEIRHLHGRLLLPIETDPAVHIALDRTFGVASYSPALVVPTDKTALRDAIVSEFSDRVRRNGPPASFGVFTRRSDKVLPENSMQLDAEFGAAILERFPGLKVNLTDPAAPIGVEIRKDQSFVWTEKLPGPGGLPTGTNSKVLTLISGGIDSPVAALQVMKRGAPSAFIHFYGDPFVGEDALVKVEDLVRSINRYAPIPHPLFVVHFGKIQEKIALATTPKYRTLLYRRMMIRIACRVAESSHALALVTGESLGQVASQTVENMRTVNELATLPVLRPLLSHDKQEIIELARRYGTYETSIRPGIDCCTLFADRNPILRSTPESALEEEKKFPVDELVAQALESLERKIIH